VATGARAPTTGSDCDLPVTTGSFLEVQFQSFSDWSAVIDGGPHRKTMLKNRVYVCKRTDELMTIL
jgi:hypothetical protein